MKNVGGHFRSFEDLLTVGKSNMHTVLDRIWFFALNGENVG